jgi:LCP family protein required for cell wall assembly
MRTTLKRGIGRGAEINGNGHAVFPPGVLSPVRRYVQPPPPTRTGLQLLGRFLGWAFALVTLVAGALGGGAYLYVHESVAAVRAHTPAVKAAAKRLDVELPGRPAIALVIGYDARRGVEAGGPSRSDTIMLVRTDPETETISMLSFPRDLLVDIRCPGHSYLPQRITNAYSLCGPKGTLETVKALTGLPVNYLVTVDFHGFKAIINKLHGVWLDVDRRYYNPHGSGYAAIDLHPGYQKLNGQQALDFVRFRHTDSDLYRLARQQAFVKAFKQQAGKSVSSIKVLKLISVITKNVEIAPFNDKTALKYALFVLGLPPGHFFQPKLQNIGQDRSGNLLASSDELQSAVRDFVNPDVDASRKATAAALGRRPKRKAPKPSQTSVTVLNGNAVPGSAGNAAFALSQHGYRILEPPGGVVANAPTQDYFHTKIYFDARRAGAKPAANAMQNLFQPADVEAVPRKVRGLSRSMVTVVVGQTFHGELAQAATDNTPKREPALVRYEPSASEPALRDVKQKGVPFRLMVPAVLERSSRLDYEESIRRYKAAPGQWAVRMVFRTGAREYWGIQQTTWTEAPVLADRSVRHVLGLKRKRTFDFYYTGSHLHMIVLRERGATFWVVNTLLDSLSNETMIAIAKGLRPLGRG